MNLQETTIGAADIAAALGLARATFAKKVVRLIKTEGMPAPLPGRRRWSRTAIDAWIASYGDRKLTQQLEARAIRSIATDRAQLRENYVRNSGPRLIVDNERAGA
ncbi:MULTISPECIES: hypothetical protein [unclassified Rhizobium]|uniref:helix-turn-helix transcriptional regulator n=1 Tax=unclassified Rhizobium TaxID=2613769 RepID=UPI0016159216|nr:MULTISPECIES: hypothetical protein [unclassified Rhizobium]MBB3386016.1 putative DNA-binding transcriptional regulator AlpA [Rhizobium sp. BK098]MBB3617807.1 putative DNA-binding transcriptional regulator AlpA [Rhizobium sp. BK609]MBB3683378.1 putative DNA-binding transcriptional regulator AlpA [Rhizobium sp. BK612]